MAKSNHKRRNNNVDDKDNEEQEDIGEKEEWYWYKGEPQALGSVERVMCDPFLVKCLPNEAFCGCKFLIEIEIPGKECSYIGDRCFYGCTSLMTVKMINSNESPLRSIGNYAFQHCTSMKTIIIPDPVTKLGNGVFLGCTSLNFVQLFKGDAESTGDGKQESQTGLQEISPELFRFCKSLASILIPSTVTTIGAYAFSGCQSLTKLDIPNSVEEIQAGAFRHCKNLEFIRLPKNVIKIHRETFEGCESLVNIEFPSGLKEIHESAFQGSKSLACILVPKSVSYIAAWAFKGCQNLKTVWLMVDTIAEMYIHDETFQDCPMLECIDLAKHSKHLTP